MMTTELATMQTAIAELRTEVAELRKIVRPEYPAEVTLSQAMQVTNHNSRHAFYRWCRARRVRRLAHGRYSLRRLNDAMSG